MVTRTRLGYVSALLMLVTVLSWYVGTGGGGHPMSQNLAISATVLFIALLKARIILREYMEVGFAPAWVRRTSDAWLVLFFGSLFIVHFVVEFVVSRR
jgi:Prokaryotic Cytochrome C oxidase subunit IV